MEAPASFHEPHPHIASLPHIQILGLPAPPRISRFPVHGRASSAGGSHRGLERDFHHRDRGGRQLDEPHIERRRGDDLPGTRAGDGNNTGLAFISGSFANLAHGQAVTLSYGGVNYDFVANYYGGTGNDLVLQWARVRVMAWGKNDSGQLGRGARYGETQSNVPTEVVSAGVLAGKTIIAISTGGGHSLALCSDGTVAAWGSNSFGELGNNGATASTVPVAVHSSGVLAGKTIIAVTAGSYHSLALCSDGTLAAWGRNDNGQLGNNSTINSKVPVIVRNTGLLLGKTVIQISAGDDHSLALCSDGTVASWGRNNHGQLGNDSATNSLVPVAVFRGGVLRGKTVIAVTGAASYTVALCADGTLAAWGLNTTGQLGNDSATNSSIPVIVAGDSGVLAGKTVVAVAAGSSHTVALCADGTLVAWGYNAFGQLGNSTTANSSVPVAVEQGSGVLVGKTVVTVSAGFSHSLALCSDGTVAAWGRNASGQLGNNSTANSTVPVAVDTSALAAGERLQLARTNVASYHALALAAESPMPRLVVSGNGTGIVNGDATPDQTGGTDFGTMSLFSASTAHEFTLTNDGNVVLNLTGSPRVLISGEAAADFTVVSHPVSSLAIDGGSTRFHIQFDPRVPGPRRALVSIASNDPQQPLFTFAVSGFGALDKPLKQTIDFTPPPTLYLGLPVVVLSARASSGLPVSFELLSGPATLAGQHLTLNGKGKLQVRATQGGDGRYVPAKAVVKTIQVKASPAGLILTNLNQTYDGTPRVVGTLGGANPVISYKAGKTWGGTAPIQAGRYAVKAEDNGKTKTAILVISKTPLYVKPDDQRKFAGQDNPSSLNVSYTGFIGSDDESVLSRLPVVKTAAKRSSPGGEYAITASGVAAANYLPVYQTGTLVVESFAAGYETLLFDEADGLLGKVELTVARSGTSYSGSLALALETATLPLKGAVVTNAGNEVATLTATASRGGNTYLLEVTLPLANERFSSVLSLNSSVISDQTLGRRLLRLPKGQSAAFFGAHTIHLLPAQPEGNGVPAGAGWATANIDTKGVLKLAGKLADGTPVTSSLPPDIEAAPGYRWFVQPYKPARMESFLGGGFQLPEHPDLAGRRFVPEGEAVLTWRKNSRNQDVSYRAGFGPASVIMTLDPWLSPVRAKGGSPAVSLVERLGSDTFLVQHSDSGSESQDELPAEVKLSGASTMTVTTPAENPRKWKMKLNAATGAFAGSFELEDAGKKRQTPFSGVLRQPPSTSPDEVAGNGYYLLPALPSAATNEKLSGEVLFERH